MITKKKNKKQKLIVVNVASCEDCDFFESSEYSNRCFLDEDLDLNVDPWFEYKKPQKPPVNCPLRSIEHHLILKVK